jgi:predicted transcriptional regulator of viral defense system
MLSVGGNATSKQLKEAGLSPTTLKYSVDCGLIEKSGRGTYVLPSSFEDEFVIMQAKHSRGIFSLNTALFLFDMTDRTPNKLSMTFPRAYNVTKTQKDGIDAHRVTEKLYDEGIVNVKTKTGNTVRAYCPERTVCEVFRPLNHVKDK